MPDSGKDLDIRFDTITATWGNVQGRYLKSGESGQNYLWPMTGTYVEGTVSEYKNSGVSAQYWTVAAGTYDKGYVGYTINFSWTTLKTPTTNNYSPSYVTAGNPRPLPENQ